MTELNEKAPPALFLHCCSVYEAMLKESTKVGDVIVYEGFLTKLITSGLSLSVPYYSKTTKQLERMGCIRQLRRGGSSSPSQWELIYEPTEEAFHRAVEQPAEDRTNPNDKWDAVNEQVRNLSRRLSDLERENLATREALIEVMKKVGK